MERVDFNTPCKARRSEARGSEGKKREEKWLAKIFQWNIKCRVFQLLKDVKARSLYDTSTYSSDSLNCILYRDKCRIIVSRFTSSKYNLKANLIDDPAD